MITDDLYMSDPRAGSVGGFIAGLAILSRYTDGGMGEKFILGAGHDVVYVYVTGPDGENADMVELISLGFVPENEGWRYFT